MAGKNNEQTDPVINDAETENTEDIIVDDEDVSQQDKIKKLKNKISLLNTEKKKQEDDLQRARADFLNAKKRLEQEKLDAVLRSKNDIFEKLFSVIDSFESAIGNSKQWQTVDKNWRQGMEAVLNQLMSILKSENIEQINPIDQVFDPSLHEALSQTVTDNKDSDNTVSTVIQKGYIKRDNEDVRVLRPARVTVLTYQNK